MILGSFWIFLTDLIVDKATFEMEKATGAKWMRF